MGDSGERELDKFAEKKAAYLNKWLEKTYRAMDYNSVCANSYCAKFDPNAYKLCQECQELVDGKTPPSD